MIIALLGLNPPQTSLATEEVRAVGDCWTNALAGELVDPTRWFMKELEAVDAIVPPPETKGNRPTPNELRKEEPRRALTEGRRNPSDKTHRHVEGNKKPRDPTMDNPPDPTEDHPHPANQRTPPK